MKYLAIIAAAAMLSVAPASAEGTAATKSKTEAGMLRLFKGQAFTGEMYDVDRARPSLQMDMKVGSIAVHPGEKWEVCDKPRFKGNCNILEADMANMGAVTIGSARPVKAPE
jgi:hypothetical protein